MYDFPTANNLAVLINGYHVHLAYRLDWKESQPKIPLYNYNATRYGRVMRGKQIVTGFLVVNFIHPGYLSEVLRVSRGGPVLRLSGTSMETKANAPATTDRITQELDATSGATPEEKKRRIEVIASMLKSNNGQNREQVIAELKKRANLLESGQFMNMITEGMDKKVVSTRILSPIHAPVNNGNTMEIYYHDVNDTRWYSVFYDVEFTDVSQQASAAGEGSSEPLYEVHEFIASSRETTEVKIQYE